VAELIDNETWVVEAGHSVIESKAAKGAAELTPAQRLIYCLWVADYGMRNAGDLETARDLYEPFQREAEASAMALGLPMTSAAFGLGAMELEEQYFDLFDGICGEIRGLMSQS